MPPTSDSRVAAFTIVAAALTVVPGADTMLVVRNVLRGGRRDGFFTTAGICTGLYVHALLSALGISVNLMHSASAFTVMKVAGACYLGWLGLQSLRGATQKTVVQPESPVLGTAVTSARCFREGFLTNVLNPKVAAFFLPGAAAAVHRSAGSGADEIAVAYRDPFRAGHRLARRHLRHDIGRSRPATRDVKTARGTAR